MIRLDKPAAFDLAATLDCGQCFRWTQKDGAWQGIAFGRSLCIKETPETLELSCSQEEWEAVWRPYFDFDRDYAAIRETLSALSPALAEAAAYAGGIRILRQEPWEALCTFILSQNNNIPRIRGLTEKVCAAFGEPVGDGFAFPTPERLANCAEEELRALGLGYRAPYVLDAARRVAGGMDLEALRDLPEEDVLASLHQIRGVGPKVAQCMLLFGLHRLDAFPQDVWIKRAMAQYFPGKSRADFGPDAGIAQQYIFHYVRTHEA